MTTHRIVIEVEVPDHLAPSQEAAYIEGAIHRLTMFRGPTSCTLGDLVVLGYADNSAKYVERKEKCDE